MNFCFFFFYFFFVFSYQEEQASTVHAGDNAQLLYITLTLNGIVDTLNDIQKPCHEASDSAMNERMNPIEEAVDRIANDVSDLKSKMNGMTADVAAKLTTDVTDLKSKMNGMTADVAAKLTTDVTDLKSKMNNVKDNIVGKLVNDMAVVKPTFNDIKEDITESRQYTSFKYHALRVEVNDNLEAANTKQCELRQYKNTKISGTMYARWGKTTCPNGADAVYTGYAGGSWYGHDGAATSMLYLPKDPEWATHIDGIDDESEFIYEAEYEPSGGRTDQFYGNGHAHHDVHCTMCNVKSRSSSIMIPGKTNCQSGIHGLLD